MTEIARTEDAAVRMLEKAWFEIDELNVKLFKAYETIHNLRRAKLAKRYCTECGGVVTTKTAPQQDICNEEERLADEEHQAMCYRKLGGA